MNTTEPPAGEPSRPRGVLCRRSVLGLAAATPLLVSCGASPAVDRAPPPAVPIRVHTRWSAHPDGPMPKRGDEGVPFRVIANHGAQPSVHQGALVGNLPDRGAATYVLQSLTERVRRIGAVFGLDPGTEDGSLTLVAWNPRARLTTHCHIAFAPDRWLAATVTEGEVAEYAREDYAIPLVTDGRPYRVEVVVDGDAMHVELPDGTTVRVDDEAVGRLVGSSMPCWEFYRQEAGGAGVRLYETWAG